MKAAEDHVRTVLYQHLKGFRAAADVVCEVSDGSASWAGPVQRGLVGRRTADVNDALPGEARLTFYRAIAALREASRGVERGPWYRCRIQLSGRQAAFTYDWEGTPFGSLNELPPTLNGGVPSFVLQNRFDQALVNELSDLDLASCLLRYVPARLQKGAPVTSPLMEIFATLEWQSDVNNGAMDQYFARDLEPTSGLARASLYGDTWRGLKRLQCPEAAALFEESIGLYAHFHSRVELARVALGIEERPRTTESDIMARYHAIAPDVEKARLRYLRQNATMLVQ